MLQIVNLAPAVPVARVQMTRAAVTGGVGTGSLQLLLLLLDGYTGIRVDGGLLCMPIHTLGLGGWFRGGWKRGGNRRRHEVSRKKEEASTPSQRPKRGRNR